MEIVIDCLYLDFVVIVAVVVPAVVVLFCNFYAGKQDRVPGHFLLL